MTYDTNTKEVAIAMLLKMIGEDPDREGLVGTPQRVVKMWDEIFRGYIKEPPKLTIFNNGQDGIVYDEMIFDEGTFYSHCEHHMVPFFGKYYFAFLPHPEGKLLGLSKVGRIVDHFSAKLQIQERLTHEIINHLWQALCDKNVCKHPPLGMGLTLEAEHLCKTMRGVKKKGKMRTTQLMGLMKDDIKARTEFISWVNNKHG